MTLEVLYTLAIAVQIWVSAFIAAVLWTDGYFFICGMLACFGLNGVFVLYRFLIAPPKPEDHE